MYTHKHDAEINDIAVHIGYYLGKKEKAKIAVPNGHCTLTLRRLAPLDTANTIFATMVKGEV